MARRKVVVRPQQNPPSFEEITSHIVTGEWQCHPSKDKLTPRDLRRYYGTLQRAAGFVVGWKGGWDSDIEGLLKTWLTKPRRGTATASVRSKLASERESVANDEDTAETPANDKSDNGVGNLNSGSNNKDNSEKTVAENYVAVKSNDEEIITRHWMYKRMKRKLDAKSEREKILVWDCQLKENEIENLHSEISNLKKKYKEV